MLVREKELTRLKDSVSATRRRLPMVEITEPYPFDTETGSATLPDLFEGRRQLIVQHFMFGPDWEQGCDRARRRPTAYCPTEPPPPRSTRPDPKPTPAPSCNLGGGPTDVRILVAARRRGLSPRRSPSLSSLTTTLPVMAQIDIEYGGRTYTVPWTDDNVERLKGFAQHVRDGRAEVFTVLGDGFALTIVVGPTIPVAISYVD